MFKKLTREDFIQKAILIHGLLYDYSKVIYINNWTKVCIICPIHGEFWQTPSNHLQGTKCKICAEINRAKSRLLTTEIFIKKALDLHGNKNDYSKTNYINSFTKVCVTCLIDGHGDFWVTPNNHLHGIGCKKCAAIKIGNLTRLTLEQFIEKANAVHNYKYNYSRVVYTNALTKIIIICPIHGEFKQKPGDHLQGQGCPACRASKGEKTIAEILDKHNIIYKREFKLPNYNFEYDFYLPELNILIEFHGIQHYKAINYFGGEESLRYTKQCDAFKRSLAREYNIKLLEFNYKHLKQLSKEQFEEFILKMIK